uniref:Purine nucleoside phosphorylase n=1 Tax=Chromera velia CCMP2878 TaxID=1169474 RepID=A0A0G4FPX5_9ALVE|mmetsp:Transcript_9071/g.17773  ORF Transcript_9071/g.17773 Transcript_9071/m.17773 type:complete len:293 (+) Transcript_9071:286-1164(+)|eukprot:Cvel_18174.t1-p1 / transcript=Cvel_18174.t1 / gene=Cvel_18174 / organism=Chromera_velia_CCMP2878 / gene_product=Purine nucleoside phosphorylase, putative / transcript_product=Purine nucleoside phosphorylase, putative / location=Cvel_scaffold1490:42056-44276(-) / protein_length=292 / sequence_SO=supercontig / SO=protein_coding / is_pseudo=false
MDYDSIERIITHINTIASMRGNHKKPAPKVGIVCGTGLGNLADSLTDAMAIKYEEIEGFPVSTVAGHEGKLVFGNLKGVPTVCMKGRFHMYEGYAPETVAIPIRVMKLLGCKLLLVTNACGGLNEAFSVGDVMVIKDQINMVGLTGLNPLVGKNDERFGPRFPPMSNAYNKELRAMLKKTASGLGMDAFMREGTYCCLMGPGYETAAESKMVRGFGADVVGMSTAPEVLVAHHCGIKVCGLSLVTNMVVYDPDNAEVANHEEVMDVGKKRSKDIQSLVEEFVKGLEGTDFLK